MTLRTRLLLGYSYLVIMLILAAGSAAVGFSRLSGGIELVLDENFESVAACMAMLESIERQDSATLTRMLDPGADASAHAKADEQFIQGLARVRRNITEEGEDELIDGIEAAYLRYKKSLGNILTTRPQNPLAFYELQVFPAFHDLKVQVRALLDLNHRAMKRADAEAGRAAARSAVWLGALVLVALISLVWLWRRLQRDFLHRMEALGETMRAIADGEVHQRLSSKGKDELGQLSRRFNAALDSNDITRRRYEGLLRQCRQSLIALMGQMPARSALLSLDGNLMVGNSDADLSQALEMAKGRIRESDAGPDDQAVLLDDEAGGRWSLVLLRGSDQRPVAYLLRSASGA